MQINKEILKKQIESVFTRTPYPGDDHLVSHECWECDEFRNQFKGHHWKDYKDRPLDLLGLDDACVSLLSPEAFHFYMPLFLLTCIDFRNEAMNMPDSVICNLTSSRYNFPSDEKLQERLRAFIGLIQKKDHKFLFKGLDPKSIKTYLLLEDNYQGRMKLFTVEQLQVVKSSLEFLLQDMPYREEYRVQNIARAQKSLDEILKGRKPN